MTHPINPEATRPKPSTLPVGGSGVSTPRAHENQGPSLQGRVAA